MKFLYLQSLAYNNNNNNNNNNKNKAIPVTGCGGL
jgi:hypothetical protein